MTIKALQDPPPASRLWTHPLLLPPPPPLLHPRWSPCWFCLRIFALALPTAQNTLSLDNCPACSPHSLRTLCKYRLLSVVSPEQPPYLHFLFYYLQKNVGHAVFYFIIINCFGLFYVAGGILVPLPGIEPMPL